MLVTEEKRKIPERDIQSGRAISVVDAVELRPESLADAVVSWVVFSHEDSPSTLLIHKGINPEEIKLMCYTRLMREVPRNHLTNEVIKKAREIADSASLTPPENLDGLISQKR
jgi:hypothetical protein